VRLIRARISNFKSALDSGWFEVGDLTCLVGKNESGKTAVLEALEKLHSVRPEREVLRTTDYPRMNWSEYEESDHVDTAIESEWQLEEAERAAIEAILGDASLLTGLIVTLRKDYDNRLHWSRPYDETQVAAFAVKHSSITGPDQAAVASLGSTTDLLQALQAVPSPSAEQAALLADLQQRWPAGGARATVEQYLVRQLPRFVYYSSYDNLPGRVALDQLAIAQANGQLEQYPGFQVFLALLSMVGTTPDAITQIGTSEELISKLEAVQTRISRRIFAYWSQNKHLKVRFYLGDARPGDEAPFNSGKVFQTRIENTRHEATIRLDERSTGFIWFFSFLVWFSEVQKQYGENLIVLLDEPGLSLHARAQGDLLRYFNEQLVPKYQLIYTTHSPFMVDADRLLSARTVEDCTGPNDEVLGTKVGDRVLGADGDTLFPLQAALGYDLTQTLFIGKDVLLVEGPSDLLYLQWASSELRSRRKEGLDRRWTITPAGGITKIESFMALFGGSDLHVAVLTDYGRGDKRKVQQLRESELLQRGHVFTADNFAANEGVGEADVEDILGRDLYRHILTAAYALTDEQQLPDTAPETAGPRVVAETDAHFRLLPVEVAEFDHYWPARYLIEHADQFNGPDVEAALARFEGFFADINALL
jgi:predicted ATP-dependent endonuclease of OLD family